MTGQRTLLVVDDARFMREVIRDTLEPLFTRILEAERAEDGLALADRERPALITVDLSLDPVKSVQGLELLRQIRMVSPESRVCVVTALDQAWVRREASVCRVAAFIAKPFEKAMLFRTVKALLEAEDA